MNKIKAKIMQWSETLLNCVIAASVGAALGLIPLMISFTIAGMYKPFDVWMEAAPYYIHVCFAVPAIIMLGIALPFIFLNHKMKD